MNLTKSLLGASAVLSSAMLLQVQQANAQSASALAMLEEVVVTARRREESLQRPTFVDRCSFCRCYASTRHYEY